MLVCEYKFQDEQKDADGLQRFKSGKQGVGRSTSGGVFTHGSRYIKCWSKTQSLIAPTSAEFELYALVKASAEAIEFQNVIRDLGNHGVWSCTATPAQLGV